MIDHTLDPLPRRATRTDHDSRGGRTWFSRDTMNRAQHFADVSWASVLRPVLISAVIAFTGLVLAPGTLPAFMMLGGVAGLVLTLPCVVRKALYTPKRR